MWNTSPARAVTSKDFLYGFKRLCNPVAPVGAPSYYTTTIVGFGKYCTAFGAVATDLPSIQAYMASNQISGITTPDASTIVFTLTQPASDFLDILAVSFSSAAPQEYNNYLPDSAELHSHWLSDAPYTVATYTAGQELDLDKNPAWTQASDPIRHQYVDHIQVVIGQTEQDVQQQLEAGTGDLQWDTTVPTASLPGLSQPSRDVRYGTFPNPSLNPYEIFNTQSPNNNSALAKVKVRQALEYAVNKAAVDKIFGGSDVSQTQNHIIPPGNLGWQDFNPYPTPNDQGDPAKCKSLLAAAGVTSLTLHDQYQNLAKFVAVFTELQKDFGACGVTLTGTPAATSDVLTTISDPAGSKSGTWDVAEIGWVPDWRGNNGRSTIQAILDGRGYGQGSADFGDYNSAPVNALIDKALAATTQDDAAKFWGQADVLIMQDAPIIPIRSEFVPIFRSTRVHNAIYYPQSQNYDFTQVWLG